MGHCHDKNTMLCHGIRKQWTANWVQIFAIILKIGTLFQNGAVPI